MTDAEGTHQAARGASFPRTAELCERARPGDSHDPPDSFEVPYLTEAYWCKKLPVSGS